MRTSFLSLTPQASGYRPALPNWNTRRLLTALGLLVWLGLAAAALWALATPIRDFASRFTLLLAPWLLLGPALIFHRSRRWAFGAVMLILGGGMMVMCAPGYQEDVRELRLEYVNSLLSCEGTPYVWGGETRRGVDCSGLVRLAWTEANWNLGWRNGNPALIRRAVANWWRDQSAQAILHSGGVIYSEVLRGDSINQLPPQRLLPGDLAVTSGGVHVLAYCGSGNWLEANPGMAPNDKVICLSAPGNDFWLRVPVVVLRWNALRPGA